MVNIIVIDDSNTFREIIAKFLRRYDDINLMYLASSGDDVLQMEFDEEPDVILLDLDMPGKTGLELIPFLKNKFSNAKIIILTLMDGENYKRLCINSGAHDFVPKHQLVTQLIPTIHKVDQASISKST